ncbi:uncharacterized protein LOC103513095 [Diaphorina citri]|uniref:Uncharacterized protein LOC103513095 n=1 Tax=Diaphorina citri TaxID=121845 RepID=A0A1S3D7L2_DIACI|nr:uncharacterized protein LOC103513095 [Diaphorina citri]
MNIFFLLLIIFAIVCSFMEQSSSKSIEKAIKPDTTDKKQDETLPKPPEKALAKTIEPLKGPTNSTALGNDSESTTQTTMEPKLWIDNKGDKEAEKPKLKISDKDGPLENATDEIVFAEDPGYKEYNLTLHTPETETNSGSLSAVTLLTALGLPVTSSFIQTLLVAYALPNGPTLVENLLSQLLLVDDNLLVNLVQSLGQDALKNQGLTMEEFQAFLLDDDNQSLNLMQRILADAAKGTNPITVHSKHLPRGKSQDKFPDFETSEEAIPAFDNVEDVPIIYTPNQEKIPTTKSAHADSTVFVVRFNEFPPNDHQRRYNFQPFRELNRHLVAPPYDYDVDSRRYRTNTPPQFQNRKWEPPSQDHYRAYHRNHRHRAPEQNSTPQFHRTSHRQPAPEFQRTTSHYGNPQGRPSQRFHPRDPRYQHHPMYEGQRPLPPINSPRPQPRYPSS